KRAGAAWTMPASRGPRHAPTRAADRRRPVPRRRHAAGPGARPRAAGARARRREDADAGTRAVRLAGTAARPADALHAAGSAGGLLGAALAVDRRQARTAGPRPARDRPQPSGRAVPGPGLRPRGVAAARWRLRLAAHQR